ncbi:Hypothetical protein SMAX5B_010450, partial [Scophthalmus maximus]
RETRLTSLWSISGVPTAPGLVRRERDPLCKACGAVRGPPPTDGRGLVVAVLRILHVLALSLLVGWLHRQ